MRDGQKNLRINPQKTQGGKVKFILTYLGASNVFTGEYLEKKTFGSLCFISPGVHPHVPSPFADFAWHLFAVIYYSMSTTIC